MITFIFYVINIFTILKELSMTVLLAFRRLIYIIFENYYILRRSIATYFILQLTIKVHSKSLCKSIIKSVITLAMRSFRPIRVVETVYRRFLDSIALESLQ